MPRTLMLVNVHDEIVWNFREHFEALYAARFPDIAYVLPANVGWWPTDLPPGRIVLYATPEPPEAPSRPCLCANPAIGPHGCDRHAKHLRLAFALHRLRHHGLSLGDFEAVLWTEMDCLLRPDLDSESLANMLHGTRHRALFPGIKAIDRRDAWPWTQHPAGYPAYDAAWSPGLAGWLADHWNDYLLGNPGQSREISPLIPTMFAGFSEWLLFKPTLAPLLAAHCQRLAACWHEIALPSALITATGAVGHAACEVWWNRDRDRDLDGLTAPFRRQIPGAELPLFVHPVKLGRFGAAVPAWAERHRADFPNQGKLSESGVDV